ncbi:uncharacterized protein [Nicotiana sylvestris]|uniref:uncharacterized protein n=1 Tax=Nicotiana sylvestris TaxID=4096 RepID=UPI00388C60D6
MDPLKYIFQKPMPTGKLAKWQILLSEFNIIYVMHKVVKGQALAEHLAENPVNGGYEPLKKYFPDEEVSFIGEDITESYDGWRMFFDGAANFKGVVIGAFLILETGQHYPVSSKLRFPCTNNMVEYEACILGLKMYIDLNVQELLVIGDSDLLIHQHPDKNFIYPILVKIHNQPAYCAHVEEEAYGKPCFHDIKEYLAKAEYQELSNHAQKCTLRRLSNVFHSGGILYRRTLDLGLSRCVDAKEASRLLEEIQCGTYAPHMNGFVFAKKILRAGYILITMETDYIQYVRKCHRCQIHADMIKVPPNELNIISSQWLFTAWGMDIIGPIEPVASNGHMFILVAIDYFTKWVETTSYKAMTKKVVTDFIRDPIVY